MRRRSFLALGVAGAAVFATAGWWRARRASPPAGRALDDDAATIVAAIVPAMLAGALPEASSERAAAIADTVRNVDRAILGLPPAARAEIGQLFTLLALPPVRVAFAGVLSAWDTANVEEITAFLDRWRDSNWALKRSAYDALHQLVTAAWYGDRRAWDAIGYPGPPSIGTRADG